MGIRKDHKNVKMKKSRLIIAAVVAALATGCFLNSVFAQESTHHAETSRTEKLNDMQIRSIFNQPQRKRPENFERILREIGV